MTIGKKSQTVLVIAVGNSRIRLARFSGERRQGATRFMRTDRYNERSVKAPSGLFAALRGSKKTDTVLVGGVVPAMIRSIGRALKALGYSCILQIGNDIPIPVRNSYCPAKSAGHDRLLAGLAALTKYGKDAVIIDFGTATTINLVTRREGFIGGAIACGPALGLQALYKGTSLLPNATLEPTKTALGRSTRAGLLSAACIGHGGLVDRLIEKIQAERRRRYLVIATGGHAKQMAPFCSSVDLVDPDLVINGILIAFRRHNQSFSKQ